MDALFIVKALVISFGVVLLYGLTASGCAYLVSRRRSEKEVVPLIKMTFFKLPFLLSGIGFAAGVAGYFGTALISRLSDWLFNNHVYAVRSVQAGQPSGPEIVLVVFTGLGFALSVFIGWIAFFKGYMAMSSSISRETGK